MPSSKPVDNTRIFRSRVINFSNENNGQSVTWQHDWLKVNEMSCADVVVINVTKINSNQVDNYPWKSSTGYNESKVNKATPTLESVIMEN